VRLARAKLPAGRLRAADEEDVALIAFNSFFRGARAGRFPQLANREDLWRLLVTLTARKAFDQTRDERRQKRGGGAVFEESARSPGGQSVSELEWFVCRGPTPESAALVAEQCRRLLALLSSDELRTIANLKMEGHTNEEIATRLDCAPSTVERKLRRIRAQWQEEVAP
jgi:DNA-directed RNA polymerase specialized sigma24 family protein